MIRFFYEFLKAHPEEVVKKILGNDALGGFDPGSGILN